MTSNNFIKAGLRAVLAFGLAVAPLAMSPALATDDPATPAAPAAPAARAAAAAAPGVVINEAYLNGGSANAAYKNKFVELYNPTDADISLEGWSLQYRSASGQAAPSNVAALEGTIKAKDYYLVNGGSNGLNGRDLPATDYTLTTINPAGAGGTLILSSKADKLPADLPTGSLVGTANIVDLLGYGSSNTFETAAAPAASITTSLNRTDSADTDNNAVDFIKEAPSPKGRGCAPP